MVTLANPTGLFDASTILPDIVAVCAKDSVDNNSIAKTKRMILILVGFLKV
jgi:hypothetical protein